MNLSTHTNSNNSPYYYSFENDNDTYSMFELDKEIIEYPKTTTDLTKQNKTLFYTLLTLGILSSTLSANQELTYDKYDRNNVLVNEVKEASLLEYTEQYWIYELFADVDKLKTTKDIYPYYSKINDLVANTDFNTYNKILDNIDVKNAHEVLILSLLRIPFLRKDEITSWSSFLEKTKEELISRGHDTKKLLNGLI
ncbi:hypothetical protein ACH5BF_03115 [Arcobacter sp. YIC-464]|uniref:hypothetical protein n=1 Tax=Arcobacter sp. YIC-464 TaxID=3376631 RepID=UPI003C1AC5E8